MEETKVRNDEVKSSAGNLEVELGKRQLIDVTITTGSPEDIKGNGRKKRKQWGRELAISKSYQRWCWRTNIT